MNDIFNLTRFGRYLKHDLLHCFRSYKLAAILIALLPIILLVLAFMFSLAFDANQHTPSHGLRMGLGICALIVFTFSFPSKVYGLITDKRKGATWMLVPVSMLEKFVSMILITVVIAPVVLIGVHLGLDAAICNIFPTCGESIWSEIVRFLQKATSEEVMITGDIEAANVLGSGTLGYTLFVNTTINTLLTFLLGAVLLKRHKIATTIFACIGLSIVLSLLLGGLGTALNPIIDNIEINAESDIRMLINTFITVRTIFAIALAFLVYLRLKTIKY